MGSRGWRNDCLESLFCRCYDHVISVWTHLPTSALDVGNHHTKWNWQPCIPSRLTRRLFDEKTALTVALFYLLPPTPAVMSSPYTEPIYALMCFTGYNLIVQRQFLSASIVLLAASSVRATGIFNVLILAFAMILPLKKKKPILDNSRTAGGGNLDLGWDLSVCLVSSNLICRYSETSRKIVSWR